VVSCERTVRSGGGLVKFAGMIPNRGRVAALHCSYADRPPQISGRAQDTTRGGARESVLHRTIKNLACLWQISRYRKGNCENRRDLVNNTMAFKLSDIMDLDYLLALDEQAETTDHTRSVAARDRDIFCQLDTQDMSDTDLIMSWLAYRKLVFFDQAGEKGQWQLPGRVFFLLYRWMARALVLVAGITGMAMAYGFLAYHGVRPVNVTLFFVVFVLLPALLFLFTLAGLGFRRFALFPSGPGVFFTLISGVLFRVVPGILKRAVKVFGKMPDGAEKIRLDAALAFIRTKKQAYGFLFFWPLVILMSLSALFFSLGALGGTLFRVAVSDVAFGWQSTLVATPSLVHDAVSLVAAPWAAWVPDHLSGPTLEQIQGSRIFLKQGIASLATQNLVSWWPFLCFAMVFYAIVPRLLLILAALHAQRSALEQFDFQRPRFRRLLVRMKSPVMDIGFKEQPENRSDVTSGPHDRQAFSHTDTAHAPEIQGHINQPHRTADTAEKHVETRFSDHGNAGVGATPAAVLVPASIWDAGDQDRIRALVRQQFLLDVVAVIAIDMDIETDADLLEKHIPGNADPVILLQEVWQPPIRGLLHYLIQLKQGVLADKNLWVLLTRTPDDEILAVAADDTDFTVWQTCITRLGRPDILVERIRP